MAVVWNETGTDREMPNGNDGCQDRVQDSQFPAGATKPDFPPCTQSPVAKSRVSRPKAQPRMSRQVPASPKPETQAHHPSGTTGPPRNAAIRSGQSGLGPNRSTLAWLNVSWRPWRVDIATPGPFSTHLLFGFLGAQNAQEELAVAFARTTERVEDHLERCWSWGLRCQC